MFGNGNLLASVPWLHGFDLLEVTPTVMLPKLARQNFGKVERNRSETP